MYLGILVYSYSKEATCLLSLCSSIFFPVAECYLIYCDCATVQNEQQSTYLEKQVFSAYIRAPTQSIIYVYVTFLFLNETAFL